VAASTPKKRGRPPAEGPVDGETPEKRQKREETNRKKRDKRAADKAAKLAAAAAAGPAETQLMGDDELDLPEEQPSVPAPSTPGIGIEQEESDPAIY